jgi:MFS family permease
MSVLRLLSHFKLKDPAPALWLMSGHAATHWTIVTVYLMLPVLTKAYDLSYIQAGLLVSAMQLGSFSLSLVSGPAVDLTGRRVIFQIGALVTLAFGIAGFGLANDYTMLVALAALIGGATNFWHAPATAFLSSHYRENRGYVIGIHGVGSNMGEAYGAIAAGALIAGIGWQTTSLVIGIPPLLCALAIGLFLLPRDRVHRANGVKALTVRDYLAGLGALFRNRTVIMLYLMVGTRSAAQNLIKTFLPLYMGHVLAMNALWQGLGISAMHHGGMVANPIMGLASDRLGRRPILVIALFVTALIMLGLTLIDNPVVFVIGVAVLGFTHYALRPIVQSWALDVVPEELHGSSVSLRSAMQGFFSIIVPPLGGWMADSHGLTAVFISSPAC